MKTFSLLLILTLCSFSPLAHASDTNGSFFVSKVVTNTNNVFASFDDVPALVLNTSLFQVTRSNHFSLLWRDMDFDSTISTAGWKQGIDQFKWNFFPKKSGIRGGLTIISEYPLAPNNLEDSYLVGGFVSWRLP